MSRKMTSLIAMSALIASTGCVSRQPDPPRTTDVPRDDEGHKLAAEAKRRRKEAKRQALAAVKQPTTNQNAKDL